MVHAAATWLGMFLVGLLVMQGAHVGALALAAGLGVLMTIYLFGPERARVSAVASAVTGLLRRAPSVLMGSLRTMRAAAAADVTLRPALVQVKSRPSDELSAGALALAMSAAPGAVAVDASESGVLVHVIEEDDESASELHAIEAGIVPRVSRGRS